MGIQSATLRRVEPAHARTTYVTGILTRLVENLVAWAGLVWRDRRTGQRVRGGQTRARRRITVLASLWTAYATGGVASALLEHWLSMRAYLLPLALLLVAILLEKPNGSAKRLDQSMARRHCGQRAQRPAHGTISARDQSRSA